ncbi:MAG: hypothetical protein OXF93_07990 [Acidobacteria bacterium]|nr:hypothetical protein [Acidobacteriota bacterium]
MGGLAFGGGGELSLFGGLRLLADGHLLAAPGKRAAFYGSGTLAHQFGGRAGNSIAPLIGVGMGGWSEGGGGEQLVVGLGYGAAFGQARVVRLGRHTTLVLLLGGVRFQARRRRSSCGTSGGRGLREDDALDANSPRISPRRASTRSFVLSMRVLNLSMRELNSPPRALKRLLIPFATRATTLTTTAATPIPVPTTDRKSVVRPLFEA